MFLGIETNLATNGTGSPAITWEYWDGTSWSALTVTDIDTGASTFTSSGKFEWVFPYGWEKTIVNSQNLFWIRGTLTSGYTINPQIATVTIRDSISKVIEPRNFTFETFGKVTFTDDFIPNGTKNIRVNYNYGDDTTPELIKELIVLVASIEAYVTLSGGSFDDATSYVLGSKQVSIGEVFVNIREVLSQQKKRVDEILNALGRRIHIAAI